jgi:GAF domain-containing protein
MPFARATSISLLTVMPFPSAEATARLALVGISNDTQVLTLMQAAAPAAMPSSELYLALPPDTLVRFNTLTLQLERSNLPQHPAFQAISAAASGQMEFPSFQGEPVLAVYRFLPDLQATLVVEVSQRVAFGGLNSLTVFTMILMVATVGIVLVVVPWATGRAIRPLGALTEFAERFALGDWEHRAPQKRQDELGRLAAAFNHMANELADLYRSLEARVQERTRQIRTAAEVAGDAAAVRDVDRLLDETARLISSRFGFYHAGVFLIDETGEWAVLRAASSEGGRGMLQRGHKLAVGKVGIVGFVTGTGKPRIALDVGTDAAHFANPDLPETHSEMALPLRVGERIIGALDVQSQEANAFDEDDRVILQTVADQLAVAIENVSLIQIQTERAGQRRRIIELSRQLTQELSYAQVLGRSCESIREAFGYDRVTLALVEGPEVVVRSSAATPPTRPTRLGQPYPLGRGVFGQSVSLKAPVMIADLSVEPDLQAGAAPNDPATILAVPLLSRGQVIGALAVERGEPGTLSENDTELLEMLASLVAVALENTRLFEETQQSLQQVDALYRLQAKEAWRELLATRYASPEQGRHEYVQKGATRDRPGATRALHAPITLRGEVIGGLNVESPLSAQEWSEDDQIVLQAVADEVAVSLEQVRLMEEIRRQATELRTAAEIARDATSLLDLDTLVKRAINLVRGRFGFYHVSLFLTDEAGDIVLRDAAGPAAQELKAQGYRLTRESKSIVAEVVRSGERYVAQDVSIDPLYQPQPLLPATKTELALPLKSAELVIGVLDVQHSQAHAFSDSNIPVLQILADQLGVAVQNALSYQLALARAHREESVLRVISKVRASQDIDTMLKTAVHELRQTLGARQAVIRLSPELIETPAQAATPDAWSGEPGMIRNEGDSGGAEAKG